VYPTAHERLLAIRCTADYVGQLTAHIHIVSGDGSVKKILSIGSLLVYLSVNGSKSRVLNAIYNNVLYVNVALLAKNSANLGERREVEKGRLG
jgi:hypothetical protein